MSVLAIGWRALYFPADRRAPKFRIEFFREPKKAATRLNDFDQSTPFQDPLWLNAWYDDW
jgi:hypothetical protein